MDSARSLLSHLQPGCLYRRSELIKFGKGVDRDFAKLVDSRILIKVWRGICHYPKSSRFGLLPPDPDKLVKAFLQDDNFLIVSPNDFNCLGVGTTQLYNSLWVYNHKRQGRFEMGAHVFEFFRKRNFPKKLTLEFLLLELINHLDSLAEEREEVRAKVLAKQGRQTVRKGEMDHSVFDMLRSERDRCILVIDKLVDEIERSDDLADIEEGGSNHATERRRRLRRDLEAAKKRRDTIQYILKKCTTEVEKKGRSIN